MLNYELYKSVTAVPTAIIDDYLKIASGFSLKVLLCLLRNNDEMTVEELAETLAISTENVLESLAFWTELGVLVNERRQIQHYVNSPQENFVKEIAVSENKENLSKSQKKPKLSPEQISEKIEHSEGLRSVFDVAENYFQENLNAMQCNSLIWLHEELGFSPDSLMLLIDYCSDRCSEKGLSIKYIEKVAYDWYSKGILTPDEVKIEIARLKEYYSYASIVRRVFYLNVPLVKTQQEYAEKWRLAGFSEDILQLAYEITIEKIGKVNFKYINTILQKWSLNGLKNVNDVLTFNNSKSLVQVKNRQKQLALSKECSYDLTDILEKF
ncbi:MAG: DnaD domain protein [Oscillospiraceae bacterium]|jgi:DnaD/phage-associated family protein|nr:DnaD domain protein [Oscillospiraceae bacterium]